MRICGLHPRLNVVSGPNEAGKTTMAEFIRSVLFGFPKKSVRGNNYESLDGGQRSGRLTVHGEAGGPFLLSRQERPGRKAGVLLATDGEGNPVDASVFLELGADGEVSNRGRFLFAFDLDNLRELDREGLRSRILGTALGSVDVNPMDVLHAIDDRISRLTKRTHSDDSSMFALQSRIGKVEKRLRILGEKPDHYIQLRQELENTRNRKQESAAGIKRYEHELDRLRPILACEHDWNKLASLDRRILDLTDASGFPVDGVSRLESISERLREAQGARGELEKQIQMLQERLDRLNPDPRYVEHATAVTLLSERARECSGHLARLESLRAGISQASNILDEEIAGLGANWDRDSVAASDPSLVVEREITGFEQSARKLGERVELLEARVAEHEQSCERLREKIALKKRRVEHLAKSCDGFLAPRVRGLLLEWKELHAGAVRLQQQILQINQEMEKLKSELRETDSRIRALESEPGASRFHLPVAGIVQLVAAGALLLVHAMADLSHTASMGLLIAGILLCLTGPLSCAISLAQARKGRSKREHELADLTGYRRRSDREFKNLATNLEKYTADLRKRTHRMATIARTVLGNPQARREEVLQAERRSLAAEEGVRERKALEEALEGDQSDRMSESRRTEELRGELHRAQHELTALRGNWKAFLQAHGLEDDISPDTALVLVRRLSDLKRDMLRIGEMERESAAVRKEWDNLVHAAQKLSSDLGSPVNDETPLLDRIAQWMQISSEARETFTARQELLERVEEVGIRLETETGKSQKLAGSIRRLMESAAVDDEESFRQKALQHHEYSDLERDRRLVEERLITALGLQNAAEMRNVLENQDWGANKGIAAQWQTDVQEMRSAVEELAAAEGRLTREIETLEAEEETEELTAQREELLTRLNDAIGDWTTLKLASALLTRTIRLYESEKQPKVMARASEIFRHITSGAFNRILFPLDTESLQVERSDGSCLAEEKLSRATLEQVYLALRLAHLDVCRPNGPVLPVLMDDVLVNFDPQRAECTAELLAEFAEEVEIQLLFFTCHPHVEAYFPASAARFRLKHSRSEVSNTVGVHAFSA